MSFNDKKAQPCLFYLGPALGGYLARPVENFPSVFGNCTFLKTYPYFLPCFASAVGSMIGFAIGYFYLQESNPTVLAIKKQKQDRLEANENTKLLRNDARVNGEDFTSKTILPKSGSIRNIGRASIVVIFAYS